MKKQIHDNERCLNARINDEIHYLSSKEQSGELFEAYKAAFYLSDEDMIDLRLQVNRHEFGRLREQFIDKIIREVVEKKIFDTCENPECQFLFDDES